MPTAGAITFSSSADHVGLFTQDAAGMALAASILCRDWRHHASRPARRDAIRRDRSPRSACPTALTSNRPRARRWRRSTCSSSCFGPPAIQFGACGCSTTSARSIGAIGACAPLNWRRLMPLWFAQYENIYRPRTAALIREVTASAPMNWRPPAPRASSRGANWNAGWLRSKLTCGSVPRQRARARGA